jgi:hypothetical protein
MEPPIYSSYILQSIILSVYQDNLNIHTRLKSSARGCSCVESREGDIYYDDNNTTSRGMVGFVVWFKVQ